MDKCVYRIMTGWMTGQMTRWTDDWIDGDEYMDRQMTGLIDEQQDG